MKTFDNPDDELGEISPFLRQLKQQARHSSDDMPKNYFANFEEKMMQKITQATEQPKPKLYNFRLWTLTKIAAAVLLGIVSILLIQYPKTDIANPQLADYEQIRQQITKDDIIDYLSAHPDDLDVHWLALQEDNLENWQLSTTTLSSFEMDSLLQEELLDELEDSDFYE